MQSLLDVLMALVIVAFVLFGFVLLGRYQGWRKQLILFTVHALSFVWSGFERQFSPTQLPPPPISPVSSPKPSYLRLQHIRPEWMPDSATTSCCRCHSKFTFFRRRHHCRLCRKIFCNSCSSHRVSGKRVCFTCNGLLSARSRESSADMAQRLASAPDSANDALPGTVQDLVRW